MTSLTRFETKDGVELVIDTETGESFVTQTGYAKMAGLSQQAINKRCNTYNQDEFKKAELPTVSGLRTTTLVKLSMCIDWLLKDKPSQLYKLQVICEQNNIIFPNVNYKSIYVKQKLSYKNLEKIIKLRLNETLKGVVEVSCKTGIADIVTQTQVIEIKKVSEWKHAIGQVLVYGLEFPGKETRIHLYGTCSEEYKRMIISYSALLSIIVSFE